MSFCCESGSCCFQKLLLLLLLVEVQLLVAGYRQEEEEEGVAGKGQEAPWLFNKSCEGSAVGCNALHCIHSLALHCIALPCSQMVRGSSLASK
jgi:hypothetical protein